MESILKSYDLNIDFPNGLTPTLLEEEIVAASVITGFNSVLLNGGTLDVLGTTLDNESGLDTVISNHSAGVEATEFDTTEQAKLDGIESGAQVNVKSDWNAGSGDAEILNKPTSLPPDAHTHAASEVTDFDTEVSNNTDVAANTADRHTHSNKTILDNTTASFTTADETKLDGIESNATADQTGAEIKSLYEAEANTNAFTDAEQSKLSGIEAGATADQSDAEIKTAYENNANTNAFTDADKSKLDGIASGATANDTDANLKNRANHTGTQLASTISDFNSSVLSALVWQPPVMHLGSVLVSGATWYINGGAGVYLSFSATATNSMFFNFSLHGANGVEYDGSNVEIRLHCRIPNNNNGNVRISVDYGFIRDGDDSTTTVTNIADFNHSVNSETTDDTFHIDSGTMTGVANAHTLMVTIQRLGAHANDTYGSALEVVDLEIIKL